jgi:hypothetical protein
MPKSKKKSELPSFGGKNVHARVRKVSEPAVTEERIWSAYEKVAVRRA